MIVETDPVVSQQRFGKYEIVRKLGRGMADVYLAYDPERNRQVVLKIITRSNSQSNRLAIEAEARGSRLQQELHRRDPRILALYEAGDESGCFFVSMEFFAGRTLAKLIATERSIEATRAARYAAEICDQLRLLHEFVSDESVKTAIVHGDIKPSNIQIGAADQVRLLDFGIAKCISPGHDLTQHALGSPSYCSPERLRESRVSLHSDLWAVGVTLYEMLAGTPPFQAQSTRKLEMLIQSRNPPLPLPETCPSGLKAIVLKALAHDASRRYPSARAMEDDLRAFLAGKPVQAETEGAPARQAGTTIFRFRFKSARTQPARKLDAARPKFRKNDRANMVIALLAGVLAGLLLFIPLTYYFRLRALSETLTARKDYVQADPAVLTSDWQLYQLFKHGHSWWSSFLSPAELEDNLHSNLFVSADNLISRFRRSSIQDVKETEWAQARLCLLRALALEPEDAKARGELRLCDGYLNLSRHPQPNRVAASLQSFRQAAVFLPRSPDPHLAMARAYIYGLHNVGAALAEFQIAQQLGYRIGPRELEQEGDGYFFRGHGDLLHAQTYSEEQAKWLRLAHADLERSRGIYEPISGFDRVDASLSKVEADLEETSKVQLALFHPPPHISARFTIFLKTRNSHHASPRWATRKHSNG